MSATWSAGEPVMYSRAVSLSASSIGNTPTHSVSSQSVVLRRSYQFEHAAIAEDQQQDRDAEFAPHEAW